MSTSTVKHLVGTLTDSAGQVVSVSGDVTVTSTSPPTVAFSGLPASPVAAGTTVTGRLVATVDPSLTIKTESVTVNGVAVTVAVDGSFSFVA